MKRRTFIKGAVAAAVSAALPALPSDGYQYTHQTFKLGTDSGARYAAALARSLMQTREIVGANVLNRAFYGTGWKAWDISSGEGARRAIGGGGSPGRV